MVRNASNAAMRSNSCNVDSLIIATNSLDSNIECEVSYLFAVCV